MKAKPTSTYFKASLQTWELVRAAYLSGLSAPTAATRFGVSVSALRKRARREGWTKLAYAQAAQHGRAGEGVPQAGRSAPASGAGPDLFDRAIPQFRVEPGGLARRSLEQAAEALAAGRPQDAAAFARAAELIAKLDELIPAYDTDQSPEQVQWRQSTVQTAIFEMARRIAAHMVDGTEPPAGYRAAVADWRREHVSTGSR